MNRNTALDTIKAEYAKHGKETIAATRAYVNTPISCSAFAAARRMGMWEYHQAQAATRIYQEAQRHD